MGEPSPEEFQEQWLRWLVVIAVVAAVVAVLALPFLAVWHSARAVAMIAGALARELGRAVGLARAEE